MAWWAPDRESKGREALLRWRSSAWASLPEGFERVGALRSMRVVARGPWPGGGSVYVKRSRPVTRLDRLRRRLLGGPGAREGRVLLALADAGVAVPRVVGFEPDLLVTEAVPGATALEPWAEAGREQARAVGAFLGTAWRAGLRHRDLHGANLVRSAEAIVLVDAGGARLGRRPPRLLPVLARARHAVFGGASLAQGLRGLRAFLDAAGLASDAAARRALAARVEGAARRVARRYRRGRDRRATRSGRHFEVFARPGGVRGVRRRDGPAAWRESVARWLEADPEAAVPMKAGGRVMRFRPDGEHDVVLKRYDAAAKGRLPRAVRAFRRQVELEHRGVAAPRAWLAAWRAGDESILLSERIDAVDLHAFVAGGAWEERSPAERRRLAERLGRWLRSLHEAEISHRDLKAPNVLLAVAGTPRFWIADLEGARVRRGAVAWTRRAKDLARLDASLDLPRTTRLRAFEAYWRVHPRPRPSRRAFLRRVARHVTRKRGPSGRPR